MDALWDTEALLACSLVCRLFYSRSIRQLLHTVRLKNRRQLDSFRSFVHAKPHLASHVRVLYIEPMRVNQPAPHLPAFPAALVRKLTHVERLSIEVRAWNATPIHPTFFWLLSEFKSITRLHLYRTQFTNFEEFGRLVCSFPALSHLLCDGISWLKNGYNPKVFALSGPRLQLSSIEFNYLKDSIQSLIDIVQWLLQTASNERIAKIILPNLRMIDLESIWLGRLLEGAGSSLKSVVIDLDPDTLSVEEVQDTVQCQLNFEHNIHLESLEVHVFLDTDEDNNWVASILEQITSRHLRMLTFILAVGEVPPETALDHFHCARIDEVLCRSHFVGLEYVVFPIDWLIVDTSDWQEHLWKKFPKLQARGVKVCREVSK